MLLFEGNKLIGFDNCLGFEGRLTFQVHVVALLVYHLRLLIWLCVEVMLLISSLLDRLLFVVVSD